MLILNTILIMITSIVLPYLILIAVNFVVFFIKSDKPYKYVSPKSVFAYTERHFGTLVGICVALSALSLFSVEYMTAIDASYGLITYKLLIGFASMATILLLNKPNAITRQQAQRRRANKEDDCLQK